MRLEGADNPHWCLNPQYYVYLDHSSCKWIAIPGLSLVLTYLFTHYRLLLLLLLPPVAAAQFADTALKEADIAAGGNPAKPLEAVKPGKGARLMNLKVVLRRIDRNAGKDDRSDGVKNRIGVAVTRVPDRPGAAAGGGGGGRSGDSDSAEAAAAKRRQRKLRANAHGEVVRLHSFVCYLIFPLPGSFALVDEHESRPVRG